MSVLEYVWAGVLAVFTAAPVATLLQQLQAHLQA